MKINLNILLLLLLATCAATASAQTTLERSVVATSGKSISVGSYQLQSTTGELAVRSISTGNYSLSEGFQQGNLLVTAVEDPSAAVLNGRIYPVPTADVLHVEVELEDGKDALQIRLSNLNGQVLDVPKERTGHGKYRLDMTGLAQGTYFLWLTDEASGKQKSWKVSKVK